MESDKHPRLHLQISPKLKAGLRQASDRAEQSISEFVRSTLRKRLEVEPKGSDDD
jgi:hypothetical protein